MAIVISHYKVECKRESYGYIFGNIIVDSCDKLLAVRVLRNKRSDALSMYDSTLRDRQVYSK